VVIQQGYDQKPTHIRINTASTPRRAMVWFEQFDGEKWNNRPDNRKDKAHKQDDVFRTETLAYATLEELLDLRDECNAVIQELVR
jgi:hypothetical protein